MNTVTGSGISSGIVFGKCFKIDRNKVFVSGYSITDIDAEIEKLKSAVKNASMYIGGMQYTDVAGKINAELYEAYKMLLEDEQFIGKAELIVRNESINAEFALKQVRDNVIKTILASESPYLREKVHDIDNIYQRIQRHMLNMKYDDFEAAGPDSIIIARDVTTTDIAAMAKKGIKGFATDMGSKISHNSIVAKTAGIVGVVGTKHIYDSVNDSDEVILDSFLGQVIISPDEVTIKKYVKKHVEYTKFLTSLERERDKKCCLQDGANISLLANIESNHELTLIDVHGLEGVGLYRTEFLLINEPDMDEEKQFSVYAEAVKGLKGKKLTVRSFDLGGDKICKELPQPEEQNPAMGLRAIRYSLEHEGMFSTQLRAILRAAVLGNIRLLLPMVSSVDELVKVKSLIKRESIELEAKNISHKSDIEIGVMVELPSTALSIDKFAKEADFFSVGTNDLIQFILGLDRSNENVNKLYSPAHHAVVSLLSTICNDAKKNNKDVSVCGELAGDCRYTAMLVGLGYRAFSMNPRSSYLVRRVLMKLSACDCEKLVDEVMKTDTVKEAEDTISIFNYEKLKDVII